MQREQFKRRFELRASGRTNKGTEPLVDRIDTENLKISTFFCNFIAKKREVGGDTLIVKGTEAFLFAAVFDEIGKQGNGSYYASNIVKEVVERLYPILYMDIPLILRAAVYCADERIRATKRPSSTATVLLMDPSFNFFIASIGDSAAFLINRDYRAMNITALRNERLPFEKPIPFPDFLDMCRTLPFAIGTGTVLEATRIIKGRLDAGMTLVLATDGLTKQLMFKVAEVAKDPLVVAIAEETDLFHLMKKRPENYPLAHYLGEEVLRRRIAAKRNDWGLCFKQSSISKQLYAYTSYSDDVAIISIERRT